MEQFLTCALRIRRSTPTHAPHCLFLDRNLDEHEHLPIGTGTAGPRLPATFSVRPPPACWIGTPSKKTKKSSAVATEETGLEMDAERPPPSRKRRLVDEIDAGLGFNPILRKDGGVGAAGSSSSKGDSRADEKGARSTAGARGDLSTSRKLPLAGSSSKAKGKAKANGNDMDSRLVGSTSIEDVADGAGDAGEEMPEHETWELPRLKREVKKYGFRSSNSREKLVGQLQAVWEAMQPTASSRQAASAPFGGSDDESDIPLAISRQRDALSSESEIGDLTAQLEREAREEFPVSKGFLSSDAEQGLEDETEEASETEEAAPSAVPAALDASLRRAVMADAQLYRRILLYEPISFDEMSSVAQRAGIKVRNRNELRSWLDAQSICFHSAELTGARSRH